MSMLGWTTCNSFSTSLLWDVTFGIYCCKTYFLTSPADFSHLMNLQYLHLFLVLVFITHITVSSTWHFSLHLHLYKKEGFLHKIQNAIYQYFRDMIASIVLRILFRNLPTHFHNSSSKKLSTWYTAFTTIVHVRFGFITTYNTKFGTKTNHFYILKIRYFISK